MSWARRCWIVKLGLRLGLAGMAMGVLAAVLAGSAGLGRDLQPVATIKGGNGYWMLTTSGVISGFGDSRDFGSLTHAPNKPVVGLAATPTGNGYWLVASDGGIFSFGDAAFHGSTGNVSLNKPIVGMVATPTGNGYWFVASDGGIFSFGDAAFHGSTGNVSLNKPIVGMAATPTGNGYWFVASDGGIFSFGDAAFHGSTGNVSLNKPIVGMAATPTGNGYWFVASDGGIFSFGDAAFHGSTGNVSLNKPIVGMAATPTGNGYWFVASDGGIFSFGEAAFLGTKPQTGVVAMAPSPRYAINAVPLATDDTIATDEDRSVEIDVLAGDFNLADGPLSLAVETPPASGAAAVTGTTITYRPAAEFSGVDTFRYRVTDVDGDSSAATVTVTVRTVNDPPELSSFSSASVTAIDEDTQGTWNFGVADKETPAGSLAFTASSSNTTLFPELTVAGSGPGRSVTGRPAANRNGTAVITVRVSDGVGTATVSFTVTVNPVNDAPDAVDRTLSVVEDTPKSGTVLASDPDSGDTLTFTRQSNGTKGSATVNANGTFTYTPNANVNGTDSFTVGVSDGHGGTDTATVSVTIAAVNDAPVGGDITLTATEDQVALVTGTMTATDAEGDTLTFGLGADGAKGTATVNADGTFSYTVEVGANGTDTFTLTISDGHGGTDTATVTVTIAAVNDAPVGGDVSKTATEDQSAAVTGQVVASDIDGDTLTFGLGADGAKGTATVASGGTFSYTLDPDANGTDTFTVTISDGHGGTDTATVTVTIAAVEDAPDAADMAIITDEDTAKSSAVVATDGDAGDTLAFALATNGTKGSAAVAADGTFTYTPNADLNGPDSFTVTVTDSTGRTDTATVSVTIVAVNDAPVGGDVSKTATEDQSAAVTGQVVATDVDGDTLTFGLGTDGAKGTATVSSGGTFSYALDPDANGTDSFTVTISDGHGGTDTATVTVTIAPVDDLPHADADAGSTDEDVAVILSILANDTGLGDAPLAVTVTSPPASGTATANPNGTITFDPAAESSGPVSFSYSVSDADGDSAAATVSVTVRTVDDTPTIGTIDDVVIDEDTNSSPIPFTVNDVDTLAATLVLTASDDPDLVASFTFGGADSARTMVISPKLDAHGTAIVTVTVSDGHTSASTTFDLTVSPIDDVPAATGDTAATDEDTPVTIDVLANDTGLGDGGISVLVTAQPADGATATVGLDKTITFQPAADSAAPATFTYSVTDADGDSHSAEVTVTVNPVNDPPTIGIIADSATDEDTDSSPIAITVDDVDTLTETLVVSASDDPDLVALFVPGGAGSDRTLVIKPKANANGTATITVTVSDGALAASRQFSLTIHPVQDPPTASPQAFSVNEDTTLNGQLVASDPDGPALTYSILTPPASGSLTGQGSGAFTYVPVANFNGSVSFTFQASDGIAVTGPVTATITVNPVNDAPVAVADAFDVGLLGGTFNVRTNDTDIDDAKGTLTVQVVRNPSRGTVSCVAATGQCTYHPLLSTLIGQTDTFDYRLTDPLGASSVATVTITIT